MPKLSVPFALLALVACAAPAAPKLSAQDAWARETGGSDTAAAYLTISNKGGADQLVGVRSDLGPALLHESSVEGGVSRMRPIAADEGLVVPSNGKLKLEPGGAHVMITEMKKPLSAGDQFNLTLVFDRAPPEKVKVMVRPATASGARN